MDQNAELLKLGKAQSQPIIEQLTGLFYRDKPEIC